MKTRIGALLGAARLLAQASAKDAEIIVYGGTLAGVSMGPMEQRGMGDHRTQAYNYRVSVTSCPSTLGMSR